MKKDQINIFKDILKRKGYEYELKEGETIEDKVSRITENNEPIKDGAPLVYTERGKGVLPEYNIRTDKWDLAQEKMGAVTAAKRAKIQQAMTKGTPEPKPETKQETKQE